MTRPMTVRLLPAAALLLLAACGQSEEERLADLDARIAANQTDPAVADALEDQIAVDPALTQQANRGAARTAVRPAESQFPIPVRGAAVEGGAESAPCGTRFQYDRAWAQRLPAAFPLPPGVTLTDAAGDERPGCNQRAVTFTTRAAPDQVLGWYRTRATRAGYSVEEQLRDGDRILGGARGGAAYFLIVTPKPQGSDVALIANAGR